MRKVPDPDDGDRDDDGQDEAPGDVGDPHGVVGRQRRQRQRLLVHTGPVADAREDERPGARGDEAGKESATDVPCGNLARRGGDLEQEERRDQRPTEERRDSRERARHDQQLRLRLARFHESNGDRAEAKAERDERRLGAKDDPEPERRERREEDAGELHGVHCPHAEALERRVASVAGKPDEERDQDPREPGDGDDIPARRRAPVELFRYPLPDDVRHVVDERLEENGRERNREAE